MQVLMVYSESGGVTKTTTAVSLAMLGAKRGMRVTLVDLDPRAAATKWLDVTPLEDGLHVGAILSSEDPEGWAEQMAVPTRWHEHLRVVPSARSVSNRESDRADHAEARLKVSLHDLRSDLVVIDCPNRQGGPLTLSALSAADSVVYAATATIDGVDGVDGARLSVRRFLRHREQLGAPAHLVERGLVVGGVKNTIMSRATLASLADLRETGLFLEPVVPERAIVQESRIAGEWYGNYAKGAPVEDAYARIAEQVIA